MANNRNKKEKSIVFNFYKNPISYIQYSYNIKKQYFQFLKYIFTFGE